LNYGFHNDSVDVRTFDGANDTLLDPLFFLSSKGIWYCAPIGSTTDGLSTPTIIRNLPGYDSTGDDWFSGVLHDAAYRDQLLVWNDRTLQPNLELTPSNITGWRLAHLSQKSCDGLILDAMTLQGVGFIRRHVIYYALRLFGSFAFKSDRAYRPA